MTRLTLLFVVAALVVPGTASAMPERDAGTRAALDAHGVDQAAADRKAQAIEKYYSSYGTVKPAEIAAAAPERVSTVNAGPSWLGTIGIGVGLALIAGGLGVYAGRSLRPRHLGA